VIPKAPLGVYLMGEYEVQVLDSTARIRSVPADMAGIYANAAPRVNACKKPGGVAEIRHRVPGPKFDAAGEETDNRNSSSDVDDQVIHENVE